MRLISLTTLLVIILSGCGKKNSSTIRIENKVDEPGIIRIYRSQADYYSETNALAIYNIPANKTIEITDVDFETGRTYYFDAHTLDYSKSNWGLSEYQRSAFPPRKTGTEYITFTYPLNNTLDMFKVHNGARKYVLGDGISAKWIVKDVYGYDKSIWNKISDTLKQKSLILHKNHTAEFTYINDSGKTVTDNYRYEMYSPFGTSRIYLELYTDPDTKKIHIYSDVAETVIGGPIYVANDEAVMTAEPNFLVYNFIIRKQ